MKRYLLVFFVIMGVCKSMCADDYPIHPIIIENKHTKDKHLNDYQKDLLNFYDMLIKTHPAFFVYPELKKEVNNITKVQCQELANNPDKDHLILAMNRILAPTHDAHCYITSDFHGNKFPFKVKFFNNRFYLSDITNNYSDFTGKEIVALSDVPIHQIIENSKSYMIYENDIAHLYDLSLKLNNAVFLAMLNIVKDDTLKITFSDSSSICMRAVASTESINYHTIQYKPNPYTTDRLKKNYSYQFMEEDSIGYMQFNQCEDEKNNPNAENFVDFLYRMCDSLNRNNVPLLIVDTRYNPGGDNRLCMALLSALQINEQNQGGMLDRKSSFLRNAWPSRINSTICNRRLYGGAEPSILPDMFPFYKGKVVFMQTGAMSSAMDLILWQHDNDNTKCVSIGEPCYQSPNSYGNVLPYELPLTHVTGMVTCTAFFRPDESNTDPLLHPDVYIPFTIDDFIEGNDPCLDWVIEHKAELIKDPSQFRKK